MSSCWYLCLRQTWGASRASPRSPRSAPAFIVEFICYFMLVFMLVSVMGRFASLASLALLGACFHCGVLICLCGCLYVCVRGGAPLEPRFARLARRPLSLWISNLSLWLYLCLFQRWGAWQASLRSPRSAPTFIVEFMLVFVVVFMFVSEVGRLASLASLASLGDCFHCGVHSCFVVAFMLMSEVGRLASLASLASLGARFHCIFPHSKEFARGSTVSGLSKHACPAPRKSRHSPAISLAGSLSCKL